MTTARQAGGTPAQVCMTLSAIAAAGATPRPSGETQKEHEQRIMRGITAQLGDPGLATGGTWQLQWLGLTPDNGNLAYIAWNSANSGEFALVVRGTVFSDPLDLLEDFEVGKTDEFSTGGSSGQVEVAKGSMAAFRRIVEQQGAQEVGASSGVTLAQMLDDLTGPKADTTVYVTGHSLGGCIATMLGPYLQQQSWQQTPEFALVTFAAPTAGLQDFADYVESLTWSLQERHVNAYDLVPLAWADIPVAEHWYPTPPGPAAGAGMKALLSTISKRTNGNVYVQPGAPIVVNSGYSLRDQKELQNFLGQVAFQHANPTYLTLLGAPLTPAGPAVQEVSPASGPVGTKVTINGSGFTDDSLVDFGRVPARRADVTIHSPSQITAKAPAGIGDVDVRVTNMIGTSPAVPGGKFSYT
ncbi:lipase family protein [Streptomyces sp. NBC_00151]|uniref:lipase family protein n=1 Tax=Streptomyces sp. NBC_00151 TaxID=2975669 RepID=UPI002DD923C3|nr:IPT/TIG domain-containing protein [Streptomyces sp. NBC_00151]WRZ37445.1 IPT/TIG domain-containing protein [Streptomyces sp. NBC_00151]